MINNKNARYVHKNLNKIKLKIIAHVLFRTSWRRWEDNIKMNFGRTDCEDENWNSVASEDPTNVCGTRTCNCVSPERPANSSTQKEQRTKHILWHSAAQIGPSTYCGILLQKYVLMSAALMYRDADKSLARPGRKQARKHIRDARDFNKIETRAVIKFLFLQGKAPKEIHAILTETLACFHPGRTKDLSAPLYYGNPQPRLTLQSK